MQRRQRLTSTTDGRRGLDPAVTARVLAVAVSLASIAMACGEGESASSAATTAPPSPTVSTDVVYGEDQARQVLDVHVPGGHGPFPTVLAIHGGAFVTGSKGDYERHVEQFVDHGIAFVSISYRLAPATTHPGQVEDVHCALAWVHEHADRYRLDASHIVVMGGSAGGYLTGMLATSDDRDRYLTQCLHELPADPVAGVIPMYGFYDLTDLDSGDFPPGLMGAASRLAGEPYNELTPDVLAEMSPIGQIDGSEPPVLAIHGTLDGLVPSVTSERFVTALRAAGVDAELLLVEANHGFDMQPMTVPPNDEVLTAIRQFVADVGAAESTTAAASTPVAAASVSDIVYNEDTLRQALDVDVPASDGPVPTILAIHGGAFRFNSKRLYDRHVDYFTERGIAVVSTNYRFIPRSHPAQVEDVHCALAWIHENAERHGFDTSRIVVLGGSAGGYLAAMVGTVDDPDRYLTECPHALPDEPVAGVVTFYGFFDFVDIDDYPSSEVGRLEGLWGARHDELSAERLTEMSPVALIDGSEPPFLVIHGTEDRVIPSVMSERFVEELADSGVDVELLLVDAGHAFEKQPLTDPANLESLAAIERFIAGLP